MLDSDYLILDRIPQRFSEMKTAGKTAVFLDVEGRMLDSGAVALDDSIYAALCCDEVKNVTLVRDRSGAQTVITILWHTEEGYLEGKERIGRILGRRFSPQNTKLNRYAEAIAQKLALGVRLRVADAVDSSDMVACPECGTLNPPGSLYCLDCGADIPQTGAE